MLAFFVTCLPDRYDYHTKFLPYLLTFYKDDIGDGSISTTALGAIQQCGAQYESEHPDEVMERRQYGIDGALISDCSNGDSWLPAPFVERPRLGARLFVRENSKRFMKALLNELSSSWRDHMKQRSLDLLEILVVYCEEHLTMDFASTFTQIVKGLHLEWQNERENSDEQATKQSNLSRKIIQLLTLVGRYVHPDVYIPLCLPRIVGASETGISFSDTGTNSESFKAAYAAALLALLSGSGIKHWLVYLSEIVYALKSQTDVNKCGELCRTECTLVMVSMLQRIAFANNHERVDVKIFCQKEDRAQIMRIFINDCKQLVESHSRACQFHGALSNTFLLDQNVMCACETSIQQLQSDMACW